MLSSLLHGIVAIFVWGVVILSFFDHKPKRSPEAYRRERQHREAEIKAARYERIPPMLRVINKERRWKIARRSAVSAVKWGLLAQDFDKDEINGAVLIAVRRDRQLVFDHDKFYDAALQILRRATNA